jgi:hypothetical protein
VAVDHDLGVRVKVPSTSGDDELPEQRGMVVSEMFGEPASARR